MTSGHRHRTWTVKQDGVVHRALTVPTIWRTRRVAWARRSRLVFSPVDTFEDPEVYRLSPLGLLHGLAGLTLEMRE